jgi:alpha-ketoglutarate-dependent taurine dioxygenase
MPSVTKILSFGAQIHDIDIKNENDLLFLQDHLENLIWEHGFVMFKQLTPHWKTINTMAQLLGNVADATPVNHPECIYVGQITGQKYDDGRPKGRMGKTSEVGWHSDNCVNKKLKPFIMFQGIENVESGQQEYMSNNSVYNKLSDKIKAELENAEGNFYFNHDVFQNDLEDIIKPHSNWKKLIITNPIGNRGLFYPWLFCSEIRGTSNNEYYYELLKQMFEENNDIYVHNWSCGDLFITESLFTLHRRPPTAQAADRMLYRINCGKDYVFES